MDGKQRIRARVATALVAVMLWGVAEAATSPEVQVLIDVSGSMKQNDPDNLRVPALRLVTELLPADTRAGIWLFAESVQPLVATAEVSGVWRERTSARLPDIHSRGLFTDIEQALAAATAEWTQPAEPGLRHVILLTDGVVDVSKDASASAASRQRILSQQLTQLRDQGVQVHAIALSDNVDQELIETLTTATDGWLERADDAAKLQRIFLHMVEQAAPPVTVPLDGNTFEIDSSVSELTLLLFAAEDVSVSLTPPGGVTWTAINRPDGVSWRQEPGYALITVAQPTVGTWSFDGSEDPDNRAVVVTDLALSLQPLPTSMLATDAHAVAARLTSGSEPLQRLELLQLVGANWQMVGETGVTATADLALDPETFSFIGNLSAPAAEAGNYQVVVTADGGTFKREIRTRIRLAAAPVSISYLPDSTNATVAVELRPDAELTAEDSLAGYLQVAGPDGSVSAVPFQDPLGGVAWAQIEAVTSGVHLVTPSVFVRAADGRELRITLPTNELELVAPAPVELEPEPQVVPEESISWILLAALLGGGNGLVFLGLGLVWLLLGRQPKAPEMLA